MNNNSGKHPSLAVPLITALDEITVASTAARHPIPQFMFGQCAALDGPTTGKNSRVCTTNSTGLTLGTFLQNNGRHGKQFGMFG
ncbi:uncharacterized protein FOMMEDRAFT_161363 [Fomitiporia mediterranea MF3/22]|uniref:uncharacterized protein n=1 Tax=Fomitiporia mediterranea (strain MF3/22) TaxID=694068 RepID=UPI00044083D1|nr:uncharacterized protein FOMMEDRAFT_161363 [Fomitiporia mediterranea MF3/22]EJC98549.1 hypothetical protein FOMMEDRAFT_161363 [Fomitiporia mediterranea MF3/22]